MSQLQKSINLLKSFFFRGFSSCRLTNPLRGCLIGALRTSPYLWAGSENRRKNLRFFQAKRLLQPALLLICIAAFADHGFIMPPKGWDLADPQKLQGLVTIGFMGKTSKELPPHVNFASEDIDVSLNEYVQAVKKRHEADPNNYCWRDLGKFQTNGGEARLTEIESKSKYGKVRLLQLILVKDKMAYIVTASALKEEFSKFYLEFQSVFRSLTTTADLIEAIPSLEKRERLKNIKDGASFQASIIKDFADMGAHWQLLMLQNKRNTQ